MELQIPLTENRRKYKQIYEQIRQDILKKKLPAHTQLPAKRRLAEQLNVSIMTVQIAYEQLKSEGYIYSVERGGSFVSEVEEDFYFEEPVVLNLKQTNVSKRYINFRNGQVDVEVFPYKTWSRLYKKVLNEHDSNHPWQGVYSLRVEIAKYLQHARGFSPEPEQIYLFSGFQQQFMNLCLFFNPSAIGIEDPGFIRAKGVSDQLKLQSYGFPIDDEGCTVPTQNIKLLYTTPAHQYPTGTVMSIARRTELLRWADKNDAYIIEDDYDSEFRYKGSPIPTLSHLDAQERTIYFGTFSKTLLPSLRMSYLVIPSHLLPDFEMFNTYQKATVSAIDQQVLAHFISEGFYTSHIAKMRSLYRMKRECLIKNIQNQLGEEYNIKGDSAGLHIILELPQGLNETKAIELAKKNGVEIDAVSTMYQRNKPTNQVMIGYGAPSIEDIQRGVGLLASVWHDYLNY
ncbi:PLP-dependent aminotransferase family protein [Fictibacillus phosphorivorans]|uniref:MocR-like pyridoxine biosynthesis transcription factor PdxR n=1 Tax=Fictibacillus phosphorivorans TaxID=1221500 RepID=UPI003CF114E6